MLKLLKDVTLPGIIQVQALHNFAEVLVAPHHLALEIQ